MNALPGGMQVEKVLDDLIYRLSNQDGTPETRAALVEAKRLKSVTMRWGAIPPPPDARREMLARVMELISSVNGAAAPISGPMSGSPRSVPPRTSMAPGSPRDERPISRREERDTPVADAALPPEATPSGKGHATGREGHATVREPAPLRRTAPPPPLPGAFRARPTQPSAPGADRRSPTQRDGAALARPPAAEPKKPVPPVADNPPTARSVAPTRRPPPSKRPTKPPPPSALLPTSEELDGTDAIELAEAPSNPRPPARPLTLRPPGGGPPPLPTTRLTPTHPQPFTRTQSALPAAGRSPPPIRAVASGRVATLDGLSTSVSSSRRQAVEEEAEVLKAERLAPLFPRAPTVEFAGIRGLSSHVSEGITLVRPDETEWQPHPVAAGASLKLLYHDNQTGIYTALVRLAPATTFPARRHVAAEEMFLVSGVATVGSVEMRSGEYMRATEGSGHPEIRTASGCVFLVSGSEHDEMLAEDGG